MKEEYREKRDFIKALETAIKADRRSYVKSIEYEYRENDLPREIVTITYTNGRTVNINVEINSNGANAKEIVAEIYGNGAHGRMKKGAEQ